MRAQEGEANHEGIAIKKFHHRLDHTNTIRDQRLIHLQVFAVAFCRFVLLSSASFFSFDDTMLSMFSEMPITGVIRDALGR